MGKHYEYEYTVTIGDTNLLQNMYFLVHFKLQGITRELWVKNAVENGLRDLQNGLLLITKQASCNYHKDFFLYETLLIRLTFHDTQRTHTRLNFKIYEKETQELRAEGEQLIVFADAATHKLKRIPPNWKLAIQAYS